MTSLKSVLSLRKVVRTVISRLRGIQCLALVLCWAASVNPTAASAQQVIAIPSYSNPGDATWRAEKDQSQIVKIMIINLNNGDDTRFYPKVLKVVQHAQAAGIKVLSYTHTHYGKRNPETVQLSRGARRFRARRS